MFGLQPYTFNTNIYIYIYIISQLILNAGIFIFFVIDIFI